jgi:MoxR-like ATPase
MKKVLVTLFLFGNDGDVSIGDTVLLRKEPDNEHDPDAIQVFSMKGKPLGYVANKPHTVQANCKSATQIQPMFETSIRAKIVTDLFVTLKNGRTTTVFIAELLVKGKEKGEEHQMVQEYKIKLAGSKTLYPNKFKLADELKKGNHPTIKLVNQGDKIVAYFEDGLCGYVDNRKQEGIHTYDEIKDLISGEKIAKVISQVNTNYIAVFQMGENEVSAIKNKKSLEEAIERIISEGILTKEEIEERIEYMKKNGVTEKQMVTLFNTYKKYDEEVAKRIPTKPKTLYQDSYGLVKKSIAYINVGRNLLFEGDRGVGKNVLTETLAWLYNRPLYEFSVNSQHDNSSMLGSKTIVTETTEDGKEKTQIAFDPDVIVEAGEVGGILVLDEFNTSLGHVMSLLNSYLDDRRRIQVPGYKMVELDPNTVVIATQNRDYQGTFENNEATVDRFVPIIFPPLKSIEDILMAKVPGISYDVVKNCQKLFEGIKKCVEDGEISERTISIRGFIDACLAIEQDIPLKEALIDNIANRATDRDERKAISDMIDAITG